uniref:Uncharacterized protein n=1 Tax=Daucus carota subsp. sativus TaxID=79200 RepID=A0A161XY28_DAUCS
MFRINEALLDFPLVSPLLIRFLILPSTSFYQKTNPQQSPPSSEKLVDSWSPLNVDPNIDAFLIHSLVKATSGFDFKGLLCPRMVLTNKLVELGLGRPIYPWLVSLVNRYGVAPIQIGPNSWRLAIDKPTQTKLEGDILARAKAVKDLLVERKNLNKLVTSKSLLEYGFYNQGFGQIPLITFDKKRKPKKALECLKRSLATLSGGKAMRFRPCVHEAGSMSKIYYRRTLMEKSLKGEDPKISESEEEEKDSSSS